MRADQPSGYTEANLKPIDTAAEEPLEMYAKRLDSAGQLEITRKHGGV
jgi:hypothetical protein